MENIIWFEQLGMQDVPKVGGKNASLGEMIQNLDKAGVKVPGGFATTAQAYRDFLAQTNLDQKIAQALEGLDVDNVAQLTQTGAKIRQWILDTPFSDTFTQAITAAYETLSQKSPGSFAVRSSATAEDLPTASFAGQQETFLNVEGIDNILVAIKQVFASLFNDRAIAYRQHHGFSHTDVALSAGVQRMVRSDKAISGVMFSMDTESGFNDVVFVTAAYGLGETVVQGAVNPDEFYLYKPALAQGHAPVLRRHLGQKAIKMVFADNTKTHEAVETVNVSEAEQRRFCITDEELTTLGQYARLIEQHYKRPMDIEWAKDGTTGELFIVQARPETVKSREHENVIERFSLQRDGDVIVTGRAIGQRIGQGKANLITQLSDMDNMQHGDVLVTDMTDPDWEPIMKRASAIVTNRGGRTCHAAIIARELGIPAVVGTNTATQRIKAGQDITVSCAEGDTGKIYEGLLGFETTQTEIDNMPDLPFKISMNVGNPDRAFAFQTLPNAGVGLARLEFIISHMIGIHPNALLDYDNMPAEVKQQIDAKICCYESPREYYIERLKEGIATIAAAFHPEPVIVRLSDFKSNEYANLIGGELFEPEEENPMLGFRGASRYIAENFRPCFELECEAIKRVRNDMQLKNVEIMVPFVRTLKEAAKVIELLGENGLRRGEEGLRIIMMCELPTNALLADQYLEYFDGFSIGSNDLTQLTLGLDRDSGLVAESFDERDEAVKMLIKLAIEACRRQNKYIGICGQGPSDHPDLAQWLMEQGISAVSLNPDTVVETWLKLAKAQATA